MTHPILPGHELDTIYTPTAMALADGLTWDQWQEHAPILAASASAIWWIGDWLLYAERTFATDPDGREISVERARIRQTVADLTNLDHGTLREAIRVARAFPASRRRPGVPWSHHREVAACDVDVADQLLERADREQLSKRDLTALVKHHGEALEVGESPSSSTSPDDTPADLGPDTDPEPVERPHHVNLRVTCSDGTGLDALAREAAVAVEKLARKRGLEATVAVS